jgi:acetoin utilization deacetylase AcuC-like enzyme
VVIFDWDVHHGDSTQKIFYSDSSVLYISLHKYESGYFYPGNSGDLDNAGVSDGVGYNINVPWNVYANSHLFSSDISERENVGDNEYIYAFERVLLPCMKQFNPDLVLVSAGFDSCRGDPLGGIDVTQDGYSYMLRRMMELAEGKVIVALEGGYNLQSISIASESVVRTLLRESDPLSISSTKKSL